ncbi:GAF domain-containing protein [bacterium]|nr:MAG: GAF domain-containing protein [bacterium]
MNKQALFNQIKPLFSEIIQSENTRDEKLKSIAELLSNTFEHYDWVGFYITDPNADRELYLGPYVGAETDHTRIKFGVGICGQSADTKKTFVIDDVTKEDNYLACSLTVKSEIVVPIMVGDVYVAQIDIDSHQLAAMDSVDKTELEALCNDLSTLWN